MEGHAGSLARTPAAGERTFDGGSAVRLAVMLLCFSALDLVLTEYAIAHHGASEINPLMAPLIGTDWAILLKVGVPLLIVLGAPWVRTRIVSFALAATVILYAGITTFNLTQLILVTIVV